MHSSTRAIDAGATWYASGRLDYAAPADVSTIIASMGRTEDVRLSPDNRRLAVAGFAANRIYLFSLAIDTAASTPAVEIRNCQVLCSSSLQEPHGLAFLGNAHLLVCNRLGDVCVFRLPPPDSPTGVRELAPLQVISGHGTVFARVKDPGSADCQAIGEDRFRVLVCNNFWNFVSSHVVQLGDTVSVEHGSRLLDERLRIPDGISLSPDGAWIAISNHVDGEVLVYRNTAEFGADAAPVAVLGGIVCPHGLRFTADASVLVADAASQYLHVFRHDGNGWNGRHEAAQSIRMLDEHTFLDGRYDVREGGIKGIDIDRSNRVLIATHKLDPLGFYDLPELLRTNDAPVPAHMAELCRQRDVSLRSNHGYQLKQRWTWRRRVRRALGQRYDGLCSGIARLADEAQLLPLAARTHFSRASLLERGGPVVCMTTIPSRVDRVHYSIESIGNGRVQPGRLILWLSDPDTFSRLPLTLRRLQSRGLEIRLAEELGPHTKYYPYLELADTFDGPLVTADDDALYPEQWLQALLARHQADASSIHCHQARRMQLSGTEAEPHNAWRPASDCRPSHLNFVSGSGGAIYPPAFLAFLKRQGREFLECCPTADDIWLSVNALRAGFPVAQVAARPLQLRQVPGTQALRLFDTNVIQGENQLQLRRTLCEEDMRRLCAWQAVTSLK